MFQGSFRGIQKKLLGCFKEVSKKITFSRPLIGQKKECYIIEEVIEVDELNKGNISAASGKQNKYGKVELSRAPLGHTQIKH